MYIKKFIINGISENITMNLLKGGSVLMSPDLETGEQVNILPHGLYRNRFDCVTPNTTNLISSSRALI